MVISFNKAVDFSAEVEFEQGHGPGLAFFSMEKELSKILNHKIDLDTPQLLCLYFRDQVLADVEVQYVRV